MSRCFFVDIGEASSPADGFLWAPLSVIKAIIAAAGLAEQIMKHSPKQEFAWIVHVTSSKCDVQAEGSEPATVECCHIRYWLREGPRLKQLQEQLYYSVRALLDIYSYWWSIIASFASLFFAHFPAPNNVLCLCSWLSASICSTPLNIFNFVPMQNINKFVKFWKRSQNGMFVASLNVCFHAFCSKLLPLTCIQKSHQCSYIQRRIHQLKN